MKINDDIYIYMVNIWLTMTNDDSRWLLHEFPAHHGGTPKHRVAPAPVAKEFAMRFQRVWGP